MELLTIGTAGTRLRDPATAEGPDTVYELAIGLR
jgi:hypothetical protein